MVVEDDGLSRNGTYVNEERVRGPRRLRDGDMLRAGHTTIVFRTPRTGASRPDRARVAPRRAAAAVRPPSGGCWRRSAAPACDQAGPHDRRRPTTRSRPSCTSASTPSRRTCASSTAASTSRTCPQIQKRTALVRIALGAGLVRAGLTVRGGVRRSTPRVGWPAGRRSPKPSGGDARRAPRGVRARVERPRPRGVRGLLRRRTASASSACGCPAGSLGHRDRSSGGAAEIEEDIGRVLQAVPDLAIEVLGAPPTSSDRRLWSEWSPAGDRGRRAAVEAARSTPERSREQPGRRACPSFASAESDPGRSARSAYLAVVTRARSTATVTAPQTGGRLPGDDDPLDWRPAEAPRATAGPSDRPPDRPVPRVPGPALMSPRPRRGEDRRAAARPRRPLRPRRPGRRQRERDDERPTQGARPRPARRPSARARAPRRAGSGG